jgi:hypothetical protein
MLDLGYGSEAVKVLKSFLPSWDVVPPAAAVRVIGSGCVCVGMCVCMWVCVAPGTWGVDVGPVVLVVVIRMYGITLVGSWHHDFPPHSLVLVPVACAPCCVSPSPHSPSPLPLPTPHSTSTHM